MPNQGKHLLNSRASIIQAAIRMQLLNALQNSDEVSGLYQHALELYHKKPIGLHDIFLVTSYSARHGKDLHLSYTTPYMLFNWGRALNCGYHICFGMDAVFKLN